MTSQTSLSRSGVLVAVLGLAAGCDRRAAAAWLLAWPLTQAALLLDPRLQWYAGASGVLHAGVAVAAAGLLRTPRRLVGVATHRGELAHLAAEGVRHELAAEADPEQRHTLAHARAH